MADKNFGFKNRFLWLLTTFGITLAVLPELALASTDLPPAFHANWAHAPSADVGTHVYTLGLMWPWSPMTGCCEGANSFYWDLFLSEWRARHVVRGRESYTQGGAIYIWRHRFGGGNRPWFAELGLGVSWMDHLYQTPVRAFSTRFQFTEVIGVGRNFGPDGHHEVALQFQHFSNGGFKKPNPGENFLGLRYAYRF